MKLTSVLLGRTVSVAVGIALMVAVSFWWMRSREAPVGQLPTPPTEVGVIELSARDIPISLQYAGRVVGFRVVEVRAQVGGILLKREYDGVAVKVGDVLFQIDPRPYEAALARQRTGGPGASDAHAGRREFRPHAVAYIERNQHAEGSRRCNCCARPGARRPSSSEGRSRYCQAQSGIHHRQVADCGTDQSHIAAGRCLDPGAADVADDDHAGGSCLCKLHYDRSRIA